MSETSDRREKHLAKRLTAAALPTDDSPVLKDVVLLAEGTWQDSLTPYPTVYTAENLAKFTVKDTSGWRTHDFTRGMDEYIGDAENIHYDAAKHAILTDLRFHLATQPSRDSYAAIKQLMQAGKPAYVSIEMETTDIMTDKGMEATEIEITGWIPTGTPACQRCAIPKQNSAGKTQTKGEKQMTETPTKPAEKTLEDRVKALEEAFASFKKDDDKEPKKEEKKAEENKDNETEEKEKQKKEQTAWRDTIDKRLKALETKPQNHTPVVTTTDTPENIIADYRTDKW